MRHDFTRSRWGHNMEAKLNGESLEGYTWSSPRIKLGDELLYKTAYGTAVAQVVEVKTYLDPHDMAHFKATIIKRNLSEKVQAMIAAGEVDSPPWL